MYPGTNDVNFVLAGNKTSISVKRIRKEDYIILTLVFINMYKCMYVNNAIC